MQARSGSSFYLATNSLLINVYLTNFTYTFTLDGIQHLQATKEI